MKKLRESDIDIKDSGSTCVSVLLRHNILTCGNVGDSRAVLGKLTSTGWKAEQLSRDHKPEDLSEGSRVRAAGGEIAFRTWPGNTARVYLPGRSIQAWPYLAR